MAILKSYAKGRNTGTIYLSIPEKTTKADIDEFLEYLSEGNGYKVIYRDRKTPLSPVVKKEILEADDFGVAVTSAIAIKNNRTLEEDLPFLNENDKEIGLWFLRPEDNKYKTYLNKALFPSSQVTEEEKDKVSELLDRAKELEEGKKYKEAILLLNEVKQTLNETGPESDVEQIHLVMRSFLTAASIMLSCGQVTGAREEFRDAALCMSRLLTEENYPEVSQFLGEAYAQLLDFLLRDGKHDEALENCNEALETLELVEHDISPQEAHIMACQAIAVKGLGLDGEASEILDDLDEKIKNLPPSMRGMCLTSYITARQIMKEGIRKTPVKTDNIGNLEKLYNEGNSLFFDMQWSKAITVFTEAEELIRDMQARNLQICDMNADIHAKKAYAYYKSRSKKDTIEALSIAYVNLKDYRSAIPEYQDVDRILLCVHAAIEYASKADLKKWLTLLDHAFTNLLKDSYLNDIPEDDRVWTTLEDARNILNNYLYD